MNTFAAGNHLARRTLANRRGPLPHHLFGRITTVTVLSSLMLGSAAAPLLAVAARPETKGGKTFHRTFSSAEAISINDNQEAAPYPSVIDVSGLKKSKVTDVNVTLVDFSHDFPANVDIVLRAPNGSSTILMSDVGAGSPVNNLNVTLDDQSGNTLPSTTVFESGTFKPANLGNTPDLFPTLGSPPSGALLADLNGGNPNGQWRLFVVDDQGMNTGEIGGGWKLELTARTRARKQHGGNKR